MDALSGSGLRLRGYEPGDDGTILDLFEETHGRRIAAAHYTWKLRTRPTKVENVSLVVEGARAVFHYGGIPATLRVLGRDIPIMISVDAMTHPAYRRRGLLTEAGGRTFERWRAAGIALTFGLPNDQWGSRTRALGWRRLFDVGWRVFPIRPGSMLARRARLPGLSSVDALGRFLFRRRGLAADPGIAVREVVRREPVLDALWERARDRIDISLVRDADWISWRYLEGERPYRVLVAERDGEPVGFSAFRLADDGTTGTLADLFAPGDDGALRTILSASLQSLRAAGADRALALSAPGTRVDKALSSAGFVQRRRGFSFELVPFDEHLPWEELSDPARWHLSGGDFDVV